MKSGSHFIAFLGIIASVLIFLRTDSMMMAFVTFMLFLAISTPERIK